MKNYKLLEAIEKSKYKTQKRFAAQVGVSPTYVGMILYGTSRLSDLNKKRWASILHTTSSKIFS